MGGPQRWLRLFTEHTSNQPLCSKARHALLKLCSGRVTFYFLTAKCRGEAATLRRSLEMAQILSIYMCVCVFVCNKPGILRVSLVQGRAIAETKEHRCPQLSRLVHPEFQHGDGHGRRLQRLLENKSAQNGLKIGYNM